jgi:hypothetical protein
MMLSIMCGPIWTQSSPMTRIQNSESVLAIAPPSNLVATVRRRRLIDLAWEAPITGVPSYRIDVGTARGRSDVRRVETAATTSRIDDLPSGVYYIRVRSVDVVGAGSPSNEVIVEVVR